jgi:hypothetical protein
VKRVRFSAFSRGESDYGPCVESICFDDEILQGKSLESLVKEHCRGCNDLRPGKILEVENNATPATLEVVYARENGIDFEYCGGLTAAREKSLAFATLFKEWHKAKEGLSHWDNGRFTVDDEAAWKAVDDKFSKRLHELRRRFREASR